MIKGFLIFLSLKNAASLNQSETSTICGIRKKERKKRASLCIVLSVVREMLERQFKGAFQHQTTLKDVIL